MCSDPIGLTNTRRICIFHISTVCGPMRPQSLWPLTYSDHANHPYSIMLDPSLLIFDHQPSYSVIPFPGTVHCITCILVYWACSPSNWVEELHVYQLVRPPVLSAPCPGSEVMCEPAPHAHLQQVAHFGPSCNHSWAALFLWCSVYHVWNVCMCICRSCVGPCLSSALFVLWLELEQSLYGTNVFISHVCDVSVACWWSVTATCLWVSNLNGWTCRRCIPFWMSTCQDCVQTSEGSCLCAGVILLWL